MEIPIRYVPFGTRFHPARGPRLEAHSDPAHLFENELVVDVGGCCWGYDTDLAILDHHLPREGNFPAASCAVLHNAHKIAGRFGSVDRLWLVTHEKADFDAYCACYLAQCSAQGEFASIDLPGLSLHSDGWMNVDGKARFDWFKPNLAHIPQQYAWAFLLASVAAHVDNGRPMGCPVTRSLASILYARAERGVDLETQLGATAFFDTVRNIIKTSHLNPLVDSVLEHEPEFQAERDLLDRSETAYRSDLARSHKSLVYLPVAENFEEFFKRVSSRPLIENGALSPVHTDMRAQGQRYRQADGIYIRDPQCAIFHHLARQDTENSSLGQGFLFTAVAYSGQKQERDNSTRYIFSLDPERSNGSHLYPVWAALQFEELALLRTSDVAPAPGTKARLLYSERAGPEQHLFQDPWFDAPNYFCTLVETPHAGTLIAGGRASDLTDDAVTDIVRRYIETTVFDGAADITDFSSTGEPPVSATADITRQRAPAPQANRFRFAAVPLAEDVDLLNRASLDQTSQYLAAILHPEHRHQFPLDFLRQQTLVENSMVGYWDSTGVAVAYLPGAADGVKEIRSLMAEIASLAGKARKAVHTGRADHDPARYRPLLADVARLQLELTRPQNRLLSRFFEANRLEDVLGLVHQLYSADISESHLEQIAGVQHNTELLEVLIISVYATELAHVIAGETLHDVWPVVAIAYYAVSAIGTGLAVYALSSGDRSKGHSLRPKRTLAWLGLWFLLVLLVGGILGYRALQVKETLAQRDVIAQPQPAAQKK